MRYSAPGKLFLSGEYAVLYGAPAIVTAVDRRVVAWAEDGKYEVFGADIVDRALPSAVAAETGRSGYDGFRVDVGATFHGDLKLGLGSSAASCVALTAAMLASSDREAIYRAATAAHLSFQRGSGSGADIAASVFGGTLRFARSVEAADQTLVAPVAWPHGLRIEAVWLGKPANSRDFVAAVRAVDGSEEHALVSAAASTAAEAIGAGDVSNFVEALREADAALEALGARAGVPIVTPAHRELRAACASTEICAKPSGAGGGDFSILAGPADAPWSSVLDRLSPGCQHLQLEMNAPGVRSDG